MEKGYTLPLGQKLNPQHNPNIMVGRNYPLFEHMDEEHGLTLTEDQLWQIERIVLKMYNIDPEKCTMDEE